MIPRNNNINIEYNSFLTSLVLIGISFPIFLPPSSTGGQSDFDVRLVAKKYVEKGSTLLLRCDNNVQREILYKVSGRRAIVVEPSTEAH